MKRRSWMEPQRQLVFGQDRDPGEVVIGGSNRLADPNPCVVAFGPGPEGAKCSSCAHLRLQGGVAGRYFKCDLRRITSGPASDHRARWPACAKYEVAPVAADAEGTITQGGL